MFKLILLFLATSLCYLVHAEYTWPSKRYDRLESIMFDLAYYNRLGFADAVMPCGFSPTFQAGRASSAEWIRTLFHDMITHNATSGTGGVDASIMFELDRAENVFPDAFNATFGFFSGYHDERTSIADIIAAGTYAAVRSCQGPSLSIRVGRIDATKAGPEGVPEPSHDLQKLTAAFISAGLNQSEMIKMVACGHSLGGTHDITPEGVVNTTSRHAFDTTSANFDRNVVTEYLNGTTANFLVNGPLAQNNSDLRVFMSDKNSTMKSLAEPASFKSTCKDVFNHMLDTVPKGVVLSDVIKPIPVKPTNNQLSLDSQGRVTFSGEIRVLTTGRPSSNLTVSLIYADRYGKTSKAKVIPTVVPTWRDGVGLGFDVEFKYFSFSAILPSTGISHYNVSIISSTGPELHTNGGHGFPIEDAVIYQRPQSCLVQTANAQGKWNLTVVAAIHKSRSQYPASFEFYERVPRKGIMIPRLDKKTISMKQYADTGRYMLYTGTHNLLPETWSSTFDVVSGLGRDRKTDEYNFSGGLPVICAPYA